jgi:MYXO-CTERM domain-containing protein
MIVMPFDRFGRIASVDPHANAVGMAAGSGSELPGATLALLAAVPAVRRRRQDSFLAPPARRPRGT